VHFYALPDTTTTALYRPFNGGIKVNGNGIPVILALWLIIAIAADWTVVLVYDFCFKL